jgi:hypothetical protein
MATGQRILRLFIDSRSLLGCSAEIYREFFNRYAPSTMASCHFPCHLNGFHCEELIPKQFVMKQNKTLRVKKGVIQNRRPGDLLRAFPCSGPRQQNVSARLAVPKCVRSWPVSVACIAGWSRGKRSQCFLALPQGRHLNVVPA